MIFYFFYIKRKNKVTNIFNNTIILEIKIKEKNKLLIYIWFKKIYILN